MSRRTSVEIYETIIKVMAELEAIKKDKYNSIQKFNFRGIDDVYNAIHPLLAKHGLFTVPTNIFEDVTEERTSGKGNTLLYRMFKVEYTLYARDGSCIKAIAKGEGMDSGDKATNKAMSAAHKYALLQIFCIPTDDIQDSDTSTDTAYPKGTQFDKENPPTQAGGSQQEGQELHAEALSLLGGCNWSEAKKDYFFKAIPKMNERELPILINTMKKDGAK